MIIITIIEQPIEFRGLTFQYCGTAVSSASSITVTSCDFYYNRACIIAINSVSISTSKFSYNSRIGMFSVTLTSISCLFLFCSLYPSFCSSFSFFNSNNYFKLWICKQDQQQRSPTPNLDTTVEVVPIYPLSVLLKPLFILLS